MGREKKSCGNVCGEISAKRSHSIWMDLTEVLVQILRSESDWIMSNDSATEWCYAEIN